MSCQPLESSDCIVTTSRKRCQTCLIDKPDSDFSPREKVVCVECMTMWQEICGSLQRKGEAAEGYSWLCPGDSQTAIGRAAFARLQESMRPFV